MGIIVSMDMVQKYIEFYLWNTNNNLCDDILIRNTNTNGIIWH